MDNLDALGESQESEGDEGRDRVGEANFSLQDDGVYGSQDASGDLLQDVHSLGDLPAGLESGLLSLPPREIRVETPHAVEHLAEPGREFMIGRKIFTLQRSLCDSTWDVEIQGEGWISTGFPKSYTVGMAEARFRNDFKGGSKKWIARRIQETRGG